MRQPQGWSGHQCSSMAEVEEPGGGGKRRSPKQHGAISGNELTNDHVDGFMDCIDLLGVLGHLAPKTWHANTLASTSVWMFCFCFHAICTQRLIVIILSAHTSCVLRVVPLAKSGGYLCNAVGLPPCIIVAK